LAHHAQPDQKTVRTPKAILSQGTAKFRSLKSNKWARRAGWGLAVIVVFGSGHDSGVADQERNHPATTTVTQAPAQDQPQRWSEDSLPPQLYLWAGCNASTQCDLRHVGTVDGHHDCWSAINETTLTMCPDDYITYS
jgi:hypothetical protein